MEEQKQEKKEEKTDDLLNEKIKVDNKNNNDSKLNSTKLGDIMNNIKSRNLTEHKKTHQKCNTSISNEEFTNQIMKEINSGSLDQISELLDQENEESSKKNNSHSRHNTETFDFLRFSNYTKTNNIKEFQIDDRKTVDVYDKYHIYEQNFDDDDSDNEDSNKIYNEEEEDGNDLGSLIGMGLEEFNKENNGIILNENSNQLINNLKKDNIKKFIKTGTKMD